MTIFGKDHQTIIMNLPKLTQQLKATIGLSTALLIIILFSGRAIAQGSVAAGEDIPREQVVNVKAGVLYSSFGGLSRIGILAVENRISSRFTLQPEIGLGFLRWQYSPGRLVTHHYHAGLDLRAYLLLRQGKPFSGLYLAAFMLHDRMVMDLDGYEKRYHISHMTSGGLGVGFQQPIGKHFRVDGNLRLGATPGLYYIDYDPQGEVDLRGNSGNRLVLFGGLQVGYTF